MRALTDMSWQSRGLCTSLNQDDILWSQFFSDSDTDRRPARNFCGGCDVKDECLRYALENKAIWGVWGGCDEADLRRALWVNANGVPEARYRFPHCPSCKARPNNLSISTVCELTTRRKRERIECASCGFWWNSASSAAAVRAYWKDRRRKANASAASRRLPASQARVRAATVRALPAPLPIENGVLGMVAGGHPSAAD